MSPKSSKKVVDSKIDSEIKDVFKKFELQERAGFMPSSQLKYALRAFGFEPKKQEVCQLILENCGKEEGADEVLSEEQFRRLLLNKFEEKDSNEEILKAFNLFDQSQTGKISFHDLKRVSEMLGQNLTDDELMEMITEADLNGDNSVDIHEFLFIMKKTALY